jgi:hypothetical protein
MVRIEKKHRKKKPNKSFKETPAESNKIGASTPLRVQRKEPDSLRRITSSGDDAGEAGIPGLGGRSDHVQPWRREMSLRKFPLGIVLRLYIGLSKLRSG